MLRGLRRRWALELLGRATRCLEREQAALGKAQVFCTLRPVLGEEGTRAGLTYEEAAQKLHIGLPAVKTWIHRLRRRHAQLLREEIAQTVLNPDDVDAEARAPAFEQLEEKSPQIRIHLTCAELVISHIFLAV
jgi:hypothetical protein